ncbi:hypothetical protein C8R47DRAFT_96617 [Mycena vitilis]|nr:hypothetical protein C8R47DRAFT_96617 [Mycena vitilis]
MMCGHAIAPKQLSSHVRLHSHIANLSPESVDELVTEFNLRPDFDSFAFLSFPFPDDSPPPIFGLSLLNCLYLFCNRCGRGYSTRGALRSHQNSPDRCPADGNPNGHSVGFGQAFTAGRHHSVFKVDPRKLPLRSDTDPLPSNLFASTSRPKFDYSHLPLAVPDRDLDLNVFARTEGWLDFLAGLSPVEIGEMTRGSTEDDDDLHNIKDLVVGYVAEIQPRLKFYATFGLGRLMANVGINNHSLSSFGILTAASCEKYGLLLWRFVFNILRQHRGEVMVGEYPLTDSQKELLDILNQSIVLGSPIVTLKKNIHSLVHSIFSHIKHDNRMDKFFSSIICYAVYRSVNASGDLLPADQLSSQMAQFLYLNRTSQFHEMTRLMEADIHLSIFDAYEQVKEFLVDMKESPNSFFFNAMLLLRVISADEYADKDASFVDENGRVLTYEGKNIHLSDLTRLVLDLGERYDKIINEDIFFNEGIPESLQEVVVNLREIHDNPHNRTAGWCFLDHPANSFDKFATAYGEFLLSNQQRAEEFTYVYEGRIVWRPEACTRLMSVFDEANSLLIQRSVFGSGGSGRATDLAAQTLRNRAGCPTRTLQFLYHNLALVAMQDKTSHKRMKDRFVPHVPPPSVSRDIVYNLAIFRPFQTIIAQALLGDDDARRFHESLWPRLTANIDSNELSALLGDTTEVFLNIRLPITKLRKIVSTFSSKHADPRAYELVKHYFFDQAGHHSAHTANARYQQDSAHLPGITPQHVVGCIKYCISWHRLIAIDQTEPLTVTAVGMDLARDADAAALEVEEDRATPSAAAAAIDADAFTNTVLARLEPALEKVIDTRITRMTRESQALHFPRPIPIYGPHDMPPTARIKPHASHLAALRKFCFGPNFSWRFGEQAVFVETMVEQQDNVLSIKRCGAGKTLLELGVTKVFAGEKKTVFILPHSGLHEDFRRRADEFKIPNSKWEPKDDFNPDAKVIYAAVEHMDFEAFKKFLFTLCARGDLAWIIFDEIHKILTDISYRPIMAMLLSLTRYGVPIVGSSATIPPSLMETFFKISGIERWNIIRMRVSRPNVRLCLRKHESRAEALDALQILVAQRIAKYTPVDRCIIFCQSVRDTKKVAEIYGGEPYYSQQTEEGKANNVKIFNAWRNGTHKIIVSTSLLGSGTDYPAVRDTINYGLPWSMFDLEQQIDRAGRDDKECTATTFVWPQNLIRPAEETDVPLVDLGGDILAAWANGDVCLHEPLSLFFDGSAQTCLTIPSLLCDVCEKELEEPAPEVSRIMPQNDPLIEPVFPDRSVGSSPAGHRSPDARSTSPQRRISWSARSPSQVIDKPMPDVDQDMFSAPHRKLSVSLSVTPARGTLFPRAAGWKVPERSPGERSITPSMRRSDSQPFGRPFDSFSPSGRYDFDFIAGGSPDSLVVQSPVKNWQPTLPVIHRRREEDALEHRARTTPMRIATDSGQRGRQPKRNDVHRHPTSSTLADTDVRRKHALTPDREDPRPPPKPRQAAIQGRSDAPRRPTSSNDTDAHVRRQHVPTPAREIPRQLPRPPQAATQGRSDAPRRPVSSTHNEAHNQRQHAPTPEQEDPRPPLKRRQIETQGRTAAPEPPSYRTVVQPPPPPR